MDSNTPSASPALIVEHDLSCVRCAYNLRMLQQTGRCPECGLPVTLSVELGFALAKSRPAYVRRLSRACWLLLLARLLPLTLAIAEIVLGDSWAALVALPLAALAYAMGLWMLAAREHPHVQPELRWTSRSLRLASLAFLACLLAMLPGWLSDLGQQFDPNWPTRLQSLPTSVSWMFDYRLLVWSAIACFGVYVLCPIMETRLMVHLARRLADAWLGEHALIAGIGTFCSGVGYAAIIYLQPSTSGMLGLVAMAAVASSLMLFWLWMAVCSFIAARGFRRAARQAEARWLQSETAASPPITSLQS